LSVSNARQWQARLAQPGNAGLFDRSSRPAGPARRSCVSKIERAVALQRSQQLTIGRIAERLDASCGAVARVRIYLGVHVPLDMAGAAMVGLFAALLAQLMRPLLFRWISPRGQAAYRWLFAPAIAQGCLRP
jgi:hypothetical protein